MTNSAKSTACFAGLGLAAVGVITYFLWHRYAANVRTQHEETHAIPAPFSEHTAHHLERQYSHEGVGPYFYRSYSATIKNAQQSPAALMEHIKNNLNDYAPSELAVFEKIGGSKDFNTGDLYDIHIAGPWNGPVLVLENGATEFVLATRKGHLEAGEIRFSLATVPAMDPTPERLCFKIESWSRSKDSAVDLAYDKLKVAQIAQTSMWIVFCRNVVQYSGGELIEEINVHTQKTTENASPYL